MASRRQRGRLLDGVLLLDKPAGLSSNHALQRAKRAMDARKAGHTGTLDPFGSGRLSEHYVRLLFFVCVLP